MSQAHLTRAAKAYGTFTPDVEQAIAHWGPSVDRVAREKYGISGAALLAKLTKGESGGRKNAVSSAGARSYTQFMPATRAEYIKRYGLDPWRSADEAEHATAIYLRKDPRGLAGYNPGDPGYTNYILKQKVGPILASYIGPGSVGGGSTRRVTTSRENKKQAIVDSLLSGHFSISDVVRRLDSGQYTTQQTSVEPNAGGPPAPNAQLHGSAAQKVVEIGELARRMGLHVGENPHFGPVHHVHVADSYHYKNRAIDVSSSDVRLMEKFAHEVDRLFGPHLTELFWNGPGARNRKNGVRQPKGFVSGHTDHVHVAI